MSSTSTVPAPSPRPTAANRRCSPAPPAAPPGADRSTAPTCAPTLKNDLQKGQIDWLIPHQANIRIISATAKRLEMPMERVVLTVREHGNTSAASIPMALDTAIRDGRVKRGDLLLLEAFGGGFTWGASLIRY
jgi:3-oxoacyl-(acyl-carrier-protein) synthase III